MKKIVILGLTGVMAVSSANAGLFDKLFGAKEAEPQTLEEACNKDEITALCPEVLLGEKTIQQCLVENVSNLSKKCAKFVKKSATEKVDAVKQQVVAVKSGVENMGAEQKQEIAARKEAAKTAKADLKKSLADTKAAAKAAVAAEKAQFTGALIDAQTAQ